MICQICIAAVLLAASAFAQQGPPLLPIPPAPPPPNPTSPPLPPPAAPEVRVQVPLSLVDENGSGVAGATVRFTRVSGYKSLSKPGRPLPDMEEVAVQSGANGSTVLPNALVGARYYACVDAPLFVNSCLWGAAAILTPSTQSPSAKPALIGIRHGATVSVVVHDPQGKFPAASFAHGRSRGFSVGVRTPSGAFIPANFTGQSGTDLQFQLLAPPGLNLTLSFLCREYDAVTDTATSLDATGKGQQFVLPNAATQAQFKLTLVTPKRPVSSILGY